MDPLSDVLSLLKPRSAKISMLLVLFFGLADRNAQPGNLGGGHQKLRFRDGTRVHCAESDGCQAEE